MPDNGNDNGDDRNNGESGLVEVKRGLGTMLHGGVYSKQALKQFETFLEKANSDDASEVPNEVAQIAAQVVAASILDRMQNLPHLLDYVAKADEKLFDLNYLENSDDMQEIFTLRQAALSSVRDIKNWTLKMLKIIQPYLSSEIDPDAQEFITLIRMMDKHSLKTAISMVEQLIRNQ